MPSLPEEDPAALMMWIRLFGFLIAVTVVTYVVVKFLSWIFVPSGGGA